MKKSIINKTIIFVLISVMMTLSACSTKQNANARGSDRGKNKTLIFADAGWDSIRFHNDVAAFILENGYGYKTDTLPGSTAATFTGLRNGDIDIYMEVWTENLEDAYNEATKNGEVVELSTNFDDNDQGVYVPKYVISGDPERGIDPVAPDLKTVKDLEKYKDVFKDPEDPKKGRIYGSPPGWAADEVLQQKIKTYGLDKAYNYFCPGSDSALSASVASAVENGEPWAGYYWEPTWVIGKYDMVLLDDEPYSKEKWEDGYGCRWPSQRVTIAVNKDIVNNAPDAVEFFKKYKTSSELTSKALAYMRDNDADTKEAAEWFLKENEDIWTQWVSKDIANKVKEALK